MVHWKELNPGSKSVPRPLTIVYKSEKGFFEYLVTSLNTSSIIKLFWASNKIAEKMKNFKGNEEEILDKLVGEIKKIEKFLDFKLRAGINVNYTLKLTEKKLSEEEMLLYLIDLTDRYNLCYIEKPLKNKELAARLLSKVKHRCLVERGTFHGRINNSCILETNDIEKLKMDLAQLMELRITPLVKYENKNSIHLCVGLNVNLLKHDFSDGEIIKQQLEQIIAEMKPG